MTREEAIEVLRRLPIGLMDLSCEQKSDLTEALNIALAALRDGRGRGDHHAEIRGAV